MDTTEKKLTSIDCLVMWIKFVVRAQGRKYVASHEIQSTGSASPQRWIHRHLGLMFNPETLSRAWRHARQTRVIVEEVTTYSKTESQWEILGIDGQLWRNVRNSEFPQGDLFD